jgi:hypothetical protein
MTEQEKELMKSFKVEELEQRLEMKIWGGGDTGCTWTSETTGITYADANCDGMPEEFQH